jgi:hypothetical protein
MADWVVYRPTKDRVVNGSTAPSTDSWKVESRRLYEKGAVLLFWPLQSPQPASCNTGTIELMVTKPRIPNRLMTTFS